MRDGIPSPLRRTGSACASFRRGSRSRALLSKMRSPWAARRTRAAQDLGVRVVISDRGPGLEALALVREEGDEVSIRGVGFLRGAPGDLALPLHREAVDQDVVDAGPLAGLGGETPVETRGLEGDDGAVALWGEPCTLDMGG
jgi:hypothetical protein